MKYLQRGSNHDHVAQTPEPDHDRLQGPRPLGSGTYWQLSGDRRDLSAVVGNVAVSLAKSEPACGKHSSRCGLGIMTASNLKLERTIRPSTRGDREP